jgi:cell division protein FtsN
VVAGVLIVVLIVLILVPSDKLNIFGDHEGTEQQMPGNEATVESEIQDPPPAENLQAGEADATPEKEPNKYFLIAGSFKHLGNASELQDQLIARGYKAEVLVTENRMYRVSAASYADQMDAERGLSRIKLVPGLEACWLLSNE